MTFLPRAAGSALRTYPRSVHAMDQTRRPVSLRPAAALSQRNSRDNFNKPGNIHVLRVVLGAHTRALL